MVQLACVALLSPSQMSLHSQILRSAAAGDEGDVKLCVWPCGLQTSSRRRQQRLIVSTGAKRDKYDGMWEFKEVELNDTDLMAMEFGKLLGESDELTIAKVYGKKLIPGINNLEVEKLVKRKGLRVFMAEVGRHCNQSPEDIIRDALQKLKAELERKKQLKEAARPPKNPPSTLPLRRPGIAGSDEGIIKEYAPLAEESIREYSPPPQSPPQIPRIRRPGLEFPKLLGLDERDRYQRAESTNKMNEQQQQQQKQQQEIMKQSEEEKKPLIIIPELQSRPSRGSSRPVMSGGDEEKKNIPMEKKIILSDVPLATRPTMSVAAVEEENIPLDKKNLPEQNIPLATRPTIKEEKNIPSTEENIPLATVEEEKNIPMPALASKPNIPLDAAAAADEDGEMDYCSESDVLNAEAADAGRDGRKPHLNEEEEVERDWVRAEVARDTKCIEEVVFSGSNGGGMIVRLGKVYGFVPGGELSESRGLVDFEKWAKANGHQLNHPSSKDETMEGHVMHAACESPLRQSYKQERTSLLSSLVGEKAKVVVTYVDKSKRKLVLSERRAKGEEDPEVSRRKAELMAKLNVGDVVKCRVKSISLFGVFAELSEGVNGLIHFSELSWTRVPNPASVLQVGQEVETKIRSLDHSRQRIDLSLKRMSGDPLLESVESLLSKDGDDDDDDDEESSCEELDGLVKRLEERDEIVRVVKGRCLHGAAVAQGFQVYLSSSVDKGYKVLARYGQNVRELMVETSVDRDAIKAIILSSTTLSISEYSPVNILQVEAILVKNRFPGEYPKEYFLAFQYNSLEPSLQKFHSGKRSPGSGTPIFEPATHLIDQKKL